VLEVGLSLFTVCTASPGLPPTHAAVRPSAFEIESVLKSIIHQVEIRSINVF
jgi:hypothetical protein